jgi:hypothetical protein
MQHFCYLQKVREDPEHVVGMKFSVPEIVIPSPPVMNAKPLDPSPNVCIYMTIVGMILFQIVAIPKPTVEKSTSRFSVTPASIVNNVANDMAVQSDRVKCHLTLFCCYCLLLLLI